MGHNEKKAAALGMPWGTANNRLRKSILFHLLKRHEENVCYVCDTVIEKVDDLSIEHKKPWEGASIDLFWDLENIAFSHIRCNKPHQQNGGRDKIVTPEGTSWCWVCKQPRTLQLFTSGAKGECSPCKGRRNSLRDRKKF